MNDNELIALLDEVETRRAAVTDAPWWANIHAQVFSVDNQSGKGHAVAECVHDDVANFIAHAPTDISTLSSALRQRLTKVQGDEEIITALRRGFTVCRSGIAGEPIVIDVC